MDIKIDITIVLKLIRLLSHSFFVPSSQVDIEINGEPVSLQMKLGENGEAFFVKETESNEVSSAPCSKQ